MCVVEDLHDPTYHFSDPDVFLLCDNPTCDASWLTSRGLIVWAIREDGGAGSWFSEQLIAACSPCCLHAALEARGRGRRWSAPMPAGAFLDQLRASMERDPETTPIGEFIAH